MTLPIRKFLNVFIWVSIALFLSIESSTANEKNNLTLAESVTMAASNDVWLKGSELMQDSLNSKSIAAGELPDPKISLGLANIASESFEFNQEPMTQFKFGISQMFPRGQTRSLKKKKLQELAEVHPYLRSDRLMQLTLQVSNSWLDAFNSQQSIRLINKDRSLFEQLVEVTSANFTSALGKTRQQDIIRSQLELTRLDDRLTVLSEMKEVSIEKLQEWIGSGFIEAEINSFNHRGVSSISISNDFKETQLLVPLNEIDLDSELILQMLLNHPSVKSIDQKIKSSQTNIELTKQKYKPSIGVSSSYGYRGNNAAGENRSDLFSVGVTFDVPLFTKNRQDKEFSAAISESESLETTKTLLLRKMAAGLKKEVAKLTRLNQRLQIYQNTLLPQMHQQAEASLTAYTNDEGDFAEVVRARISVLNAELEDLAIKVAIQKSIIQINYFLSSNYQQIIGIENSMENSK
jgi:outer membrane protein TolC